MVKVYFIALLLKPYVLDLKVAPSNKLLTSEAIQLTVFVILYCQKICEFQLSGPFVVLLLRQGVTVPYHLYDWRSLLCMLQTLITTLIFCAVNSACRQCLMNFFIVHTVNSTTVGAANFPSRLYNRWCHGGHKRWYLYVWPFPYQYVIIAHGWERLRQTIAITLRKTKQSAACDACRWKAMLSCPTD